MIHPLEFLVLAEDLMQGGSEAEWRTAVSRGYYAVFLVARALFVDLGFRVPRASRAHAYLWMRLSNTGVPQVDAAGAALNDLQGERNTADYDIRLTLAQADALVLVQAARRVIQQLDDCRIEPLRTQVRDAMRDYERHVLGDITWQGP